MDRIRALLEKLKSFHEKNPRRTTILGVAVVVLMLFSYGALQYTSQPGFCINCHEMDPAFNNWKTSVHASLICNDCHIKPGFMNLVLHKMTSYKEIIAHFKTYGKPGAPAIHASELRPINEACLGNCHSLKRQFSFSGHLNVPHEKHIKLGLQCTTCHSRVVHGDPDQRKPKMETCFTCHDGKKAPNKCGVCHTKMDTPDSHKQANWLQIHGQMSKTINCGKCHKWRPDWCMQCHKQKPQSHMTSWRARHGEIAKADRKACNACHLPDFCMRCHGIQP